MGDRWAPHVTVATVVHDHEGRLLMVQERIGGHSVLNQPAGHLEPGESLLDGARRECLEETGWEVTLTGLIGIYQWQAPDGTPFLRFTFAARPLCHHPDRELDTGIETALWLAPDALEQATNLRSPLVLRCVQDWQSRPLHPLSVVELLS